MPALAADDCHIDLLGGGNFGQSQHISSSGPLTDKFDLKGRAAGVGFGCTWFHSRWATGVTADLMRTTAKGHSQELPPNTSFTSYTELQWISTLRLVVGYHGGGERNMLYLTGGAAAAPVKASVCPNGVTSGSFCAIESQTLYGLVAGFGSQWQFARHWSLNGEILIFSFEKRPYLNPPPPGFADRAGGLEPEVQLARMGLSFHF